MAAQKQILFEIYKWGVVVPLLVLSTFLIGGLSIIVSLLGGGQWSARNLGSLWARVNAFVSLMNIDIEGLEHLDHSQSYVVVANHQSLLDIYALYGFLPIDIKWVMKQELRRIPVLGLVCELMGHIYIDRSRTQSAVASITAAADNPIPAGVMHRNDGSELTDAAEFRETGNELIETVGIDPPGPTASHKGFGLAAVVEVLTNVLTQG